MEVLLKSTVKALIRHKQLFDDKLLACAATKEVEDEEEDLEA